jgi:hypothetical protein
MPHDWCPYETEAESGVLPPQAREQLGLPEAERSKEGSSPGGFKDGNPRKLTCQPSQSHILLLLLYHSKWNIETSHDLCEEQLCQVQAHPLGPGKVLSLDWAGNKKQLAVSQQQNECVHPLEECFSQPWHFPDTTRGWAPEKYRRRWMRPVLGTSEPPWTVPDFSWPMNSTTSEHIVWILPLVQGQLPRNSCGFWDCAIVHGNLMNFISERPIIGKRQILFFSF